MALRLNDQLGVTALGFDQLNDVIHYLIDNAVVGSDLGEACPNRFTMGDLVSEGDEAVDAVLSLVN